MPKIRRNALRRPSAVVRSAALDRAVICTPELVDSIAKATLAGAKYESDKVDASRLGAQGSTVAESGMKTPELLETLLNASISASQYEYDKAKANWASAETKAQATVTIAGIFIAAMVAFLHDNVEQTDGVARILLLLSLVLLSLTIVFAMNCLVLRRIMAVPEWANFDKMYTDIFESASESNERERLIGFYRQHFILLGGAIREINESLEIKTGWLLKGQIALCAAVSTSSLEIVYKFLMS